MCKFYIIECAGNCVYGNPANPKNVHEWQPGEPLGFPEKGGDMAILQQPEPESPERPIASFTSATTTPEEIPKKLQWFDEFVAEMREMILIGTDKYTGAEKDQWETIDIMPKMFGTEKFVGYILNDITKRLIRFNNQGRERDLFKIALWCYLLWKFWFKENPKEVAEKYYGLKEGQTKEEYEHQ